MGLGKGGGVKNRGIKGVVIVWGATVAAVRKWGEAGSDCSGEAVQDDLKIVPVGCADATELSRRISRKARPRLLCSWQTPYLPA
jgi:hypothetical protein